MKKKKKNPTHNRARTNNSVEALRGCGAKVQEKQSKEKAVTTHSTFWISTGGHDVGSFISARLFDFRHFFRAPLVASLNIGIYIGNALLQRHNGLRALQIFVVQRHIGAIAQSLRVRRYLSQSVCRVPLTRDGSGFKTLPIGYVLLSLGLHALRKFTIE